MEIKDWSEGLSLSDKTNGCIWYRSSFIEQWKHDVRGEGQAVHECVRVCVCVLQREIFQKCAHRKGDRT